MTDRQVTERHSTDRHGSDHAVYDRMSHDRAVYDRTTYDRTSYDRRGERRQPARPCEEDKLFEFLRSLHKFLLAPQDAATGGLAERPTDGSAAKRANPPTTAG